MRAMPLKRLVAWHLFPEAVRFQEQGVGPRREMIVMIDRVVAFVARHAGRERSTAMKAVSLVSGLVVYLIVAAVALGTAGHTLGRFVSLGLPEAVEVLLGLAFVSIGLFAMAWSLLSFWHVGNGTPVPSASPTRPVTSGPFRYTRNPIKLGAVLFYFGIDTAFDSLVTGLVMLAVGVSLGTIYHKVIEEKELKLRFGHEYEEYRRKTSFLIPWPPRNANMS